MNISQLVVSELTVSQEVAIFISVLTSLESGEPICLAIHHFVSPFIFRGVCERLMWASLTSVLISRFSLNLRLLIEEIPNTVPVSTPSQIELGTSIWRSPSMLTGNMGGSLEHIEGQQDAEKSAIDQRPNTSAPWMIYDDASTSSMSPDTLKVSYVF